MKILCVFGRHNYGDPKRGEGYEYTNFIPALRRLGHDVFFIESWSRTRYRDFRELNASLLKAVERYRPDVVFSVMHTYEVWLETWEILRDSGMAATVCWAADDSWKYAQFSRIVAPAFHAFTTTYPNVYSRYREDGISSVFLTQWAASAASLHPALPAVQCKYPVSFVGTAHGNRKQWIEALYRQGIEVACFGHGWPRGPIATCDLGGVIRNSAISLNFANSEPVWNNFLPRHTNQIKARTFEVPGAGGFLLSEWANDLDRYYVPGREIGVFHDVDELGQKIRYYLGHPAARDAIAANGFERTRSEHTYDHRLAEVLDFTLRRRKEYLEQRNMSPAGVIDWKKFGEAARRYRTHLPHELLKRTLVTLCSAVWGPVRGPRAARRLVFELSWRLAGTHTYTASGWPGRLFYEVS